MNTTEKIHLSIKGRWNNPKQEPSVIIMHPKLYQEFVFELTEKDIFPPYRMNGIIQFHGLEIITSLDLKEDEFRVY